MVVEIYFGDNRIHSNPQKIDSYFFVQKNQSKEGNLQVKMWIDEIYITS